MRSSQVLAAVAAQLNYEAGAPEIPSLYFFTDPERTAEPLRAAARLPEGAAVVYRHFSAPDRMEIARRLAAVCRRRELFLLIGADPELALACGAHGVHWPQHLAPRDRTRGFRFVTASAHDARAVQAASRAGFDACFLSPVFPTSSAAQRPVIGLARASRLARSSATPVIALGGVRRSNASRLLGSGFAGIAAVEALARA